MYNQVGGPLRRQVALRVAVIALLLAGCSPTQAAGDGSPSTASSDSVRRFGESEAAHRVVDEATATRLLANTFLGTSSVTDDVPTDLTGRHARVRQGPAHEVRKLPGVYDQDKINGAYYGPPQIVVRDPAVEPTEAAPTSPNALLGPSQESKGVGIGGTARNNAGDWILSIDIAPEAVAGVSQRTLDVFCVASLRNIIGTTDEVALYHYSGSWTFGSQPDGTIVLQRTLYPNQLARPVPDRTFRVTR